VRVVCSSAEIFARFSGRSTTESDGGDVGAAFRFPREDVPGSESDPPERVESEGVDSRKGAAIKLGVQCARARKKYYEVHHIEEHRIYLHLQQKSLLLPVQVLHSLGLTQKYPLRNILSPAV